MISGGLLGLTLWLFTLAPYAYFSTLSTLRDTTTEIMKMSGPDAASIVTEVQREQRMFNEGRERFLRRQEKNTTPSTQNNPHKIITEALSKVSQGIQDLVDAEANRGKHKGRKSSWYEDIKDIDTDLLAYLGLNTCMDSVSIGNSRTTAITKIGHRIELESWAKGLKDYDAKLANRIETKVTKDHSADRYRVKAARIIASKAGYKRTPWTEERRVKAATPVMNAILEHSGVFEIWEQKKPRNTIYKIGLTYEASNRLAEMDFSSSWQEPMLAPMIIPPKPWVTFDTGCYYDEVTAAQVPLVRGASYTQEKAIRYQLEKSKEAKPDYLEAINAIQATPLVINPLILEAVEWAWMENKVLSKFPLREAIPFEKRPADWESMDEYEQKGWRLRSREIRTKNREIDGGRALMLQDLTTAKELSQFDEFYLPWNFDFRGRVYPVPHFSYHRDDHIKAMFNLKRGKRMDADAVAWLAVHLANNGDFDKISKQSLDDRIAWVEDNHETIYKTGRDYVGMFDHWSQADKPFQYLAACHEYANWVDQGDSYVCGLPVGLDGTNSGVQHYAASNLNENDGALVNLTPADKPQDVYQAVADKVIEELESSSDLEALQWLNYGVTRKTVKRNVMTYGYSSAQFGFGDQIMEDTMKPLADAVMRGHQVGHPFGDGKDQRKAACYLAACTYRAVQEVISSAAAGMDFFQAIAGALAEENKELGWKTPVGFPVIQKYNHWDVKKIKIYLHDRDVGLPKRTQISVRERGKHTVDKRKAKAAVSPNVIHSMDSAHLLMTVLTAKDNGIQDFFMIHDSFGVTPADTDIMFQAVRLSFIDIYQDWCLYDDFLYQAQQQLSIAGAEKLQANVTIPPKGNLDLTQVLDSDYCFS